MANYLVKLYFQDPEFDPLKYGDVCGNKDFAHFVCRDKVDAVVVYGKFSNFAVIAITPSGENIILPPWAIDTMTVWGRVEDGMDKLTIRLGRVAPVADVYVFSVETDQTVVGLLQKGERCNNFTSIERPSFQRQYEQGSSSAVGFFNKETLTEPGFYRIISRHATEDFKAGKLTDKSHRDIVYSNYSFFVDKHLYERVERNTQHLPSGPASFMLSSCNNNLVNLRNKAPWIKQVTNQDPENVLKFWRKSLDSRKKRNKEEVVALGQDCENHFARHLRNNEAGHLEWFNEGLAIPVETLPERSLPNQDRTAHYIPLLSWGTTSKLSDHSFNPEILNAQLPDKKYESIFTLSLKAQELKKQTLEEQSLVVKIPLRKLFKAKLEAPSETPKLTKPMAHVRPLQSQDLVSAEVLLEEDEDSLPNTMLAPPPPKRRAISPEFVEEEVISDFAWQNLLEDAPANINPEDYIDFNSLEELGDLSGFL